MKKLNLSEKSIYIFSIFGTLLVMMLVGGNNVAGIRLWIPLSNSNIKYYIVWCACLLTIFVGSKKRLDSITCVLLLRSILLSVNTLFHINEYPDSWRINAVSQLFIPWIYYSSTRVKISRLEAEKYILKTSIILSTILSLQVVAQFINSTVILGLHWNYVKSTIETPLGRTNYLAAFLLIFLIIIDALMEESGRKYVHISLCISGIFATMSDGNYVLTIVYFVYKAIMHRKFNTDKKKVSNTRKVLSISSAIILIVIVAYIFKDTLYGAYEHFLKNTIYSGTVDKLLNGRTSVYQNSIEIIKSAPILGIGLGTIIGQTTRSHNVILQLLVSGGILNLIFFLYSYIKVMNFNHRNLNDRVSKAVFLVMIFSLINSMYEVTFQSLQYDVLLFSLMGLSKNMNSINYERD